MFSCRAPARRNGLRPASRVVPGPVPPTPMTHALRAGSSPTRYCRVSSDAPLTSMVTTRTSHVQHHGPCKARRNTVESPVSVKRPHRDRYLLTFSMLRWSAEGFSDRLTRSAAALGAVRMSRGRRCLHILLYSGPKTQSTSASHLSRTRRTEHIPSSSSIPAIPNPPFSRDPQGSAPRGRRGRRL